MPGPRDYLTGTRHALFVLSQGACYYPGCSRQVISWIDDGTPAVDTQIAHIRGAFPGSPRFDPAMDDEERRSFPCGCPILRRRWSGGVSVLVDEAVAPSC